VWRRCKPSIHCEMEPTSSAVEQMLCSPRNRLVHADKNMLDRLLEVGKLRLISSGLPVKIDRALNRRFRQISAPHRPSTSGNRPGIPL